MNELITFKGSNNGLHLIIDRQADFSKIQEALQQKLASCPNFFENNTIITLEDNDFSDDKKTILINIFKQYHLNLKFISPEEIKIQQQAKKLAENLVIKRTIRGGEEIFAKGSIIIYGNVNPGAKIIAGGNIDIHGHCRGIVQAGIYGDINSYIIADKLSPLQIRIAHLIARAPDNQDDNASNTHTEKAMIRENNIVLEPYQR